MDECYCTLFQTTASVFKGKRRCPNHFCQVRESKFWRKCIKNELVVKKNAILLMPVSYNVANFANKTTLVKIIILPTDEIARL